MRSLFSSVARGPCGPRGPGMWSGGTRPGRGDQERACGWDELRRKTLGSWHHVGSAGQGAKCRQSVVKRDEF